MGEKSETPKRHCWECLRRCVVCDSTRPGCNRCAAAGSVCPGYGDVKPTRLVWLAPGKVKSRVRRRKGSSALSAEPTEFRGHVHPNPASAAHAYPSDVPGLVYQSIPRFGVDTDADAMVHAAEYYNTCIYQDLVPLRELGDHPGIYRISPSLVRESISLPDYLQLGMLCMALSHRMNRIWGDPQVNHKALAERFYTHRGNAIRSLRELLNQESHRTSDVVIAGIVTLLLVDLQQGASLNWRPHVEGAIKLIQLRGGFAALADFKTLEPQLLFLCFMAVLGNTTCPASDLSMTPAHLAALDVILRSTLAPFQMCPTPLFGEIIRINHLRLRATTPTTPPNPNPKPTPAHLTLEAHQIHSHILTFSPSHWAATKPRAREDWALAGRIYHAAVALYWASALQSAGVLVPTPALRVECAAHARLLQSLLARGVASSRIWLCMLWPLVVLGVQAAGGGGGGGGGARGDGDGDGCGGGVGVVPVRDFVAAQLPMLARRGGTYAPLVAKGVLERFWASGETRWDACFDRPYAFVMQIAVDMSRITSPSPPGEGPVPARGSP
ncbi:fungal-specific transcription factor domain-containing protein [Chaetomium tenue]|uniref:Fungal-specific transcription factor domain-containing protein n=1 Tax=Chaetomium tenue TaxID=1854479 RepID=A0ACB7PK24_9PEZI|nr:fungal-specific transcription factor domain-containing protein [Chaetomium globosum]